MTEPTPIPNRRRADALLTSGLDDMATTGPTSHNGAMLSAAVPFALLAIADSIEHLARSVDRLTSGRPTETRW